MIFRYSKANASFSSQPPPQTNIMPMNMVSLHRRRPGGVIQKQNTQEQPYVEEPKPKTMLWGEPTWFLFHTLAEKVKPKDFPKVRESLIRIIIRICSNLPCPDCANHALQYMNGINFEVVQTKEQLKTLLWQFHNAVNQRKNYKMFPFEKLDKYARANTNNIAQNFLHHFEKRTYSMRVGTHSFHRSMAITEIRKWLSSNIHFFQ